MAKPPTLAHSQGDTHAQAGAGRERLGLFYVKVKLKVQRLLGAAPSPSLPSPFREDEAGRNPEGTGHLHSMVPNSNPLAHSLFHHKVGTPYPPPLLTGGPGAERGHHRCPAQGHACLVRVKMARGLAKCGALLSENVSRVLNIFFKVPRLGTRFRPGHVPICDFPNISSWKNPPGPRQVGLSGEDPLAPAPGGRRGTQPLSAGWCWVTSVMKALGMNGVISLSLQTKPEAKGEETCRCHSE